jgi:SAM-dependent methyltransferase
MMADTQIRFEDGDSYERYMGAWTRSVGELFLDWLSPPPGLRWIDIGCGTGAFTELLVERVSPAEIAGIDPSEAQLAFARTRLPPPVAQFRQGDAMALPYPDGRFDAAVMALVIFFVPDPAKGVAEMVRVAAPGGIIAAYAWDLAGAGLPAEPVHAAMREMGIAYPLPPSAQASRREALEALWTAAGLDGVETREFAVQRTFADFDEFWAIHIKTPNIRPVLSGLPAQDQERLRERVRARLGAQRPGPITRTARANAVKGRVPG